jgi:hypothetical protein
MRSLQFFVFIFTIFLITGCSGTDHSKVDGILRDYSRIAGCSYIIELEGGDILEPINLHEFDPEPTDGRRVTISYVENHTIASNCNAGQLVEIKEYITSD